MSDYKLTINIPEGSKTIDLTDKLTIGSGDDCDVQMDGLNESHLEFQITEDALLLINHSETETFLKDQELKPGKKYILEDNDVIKFNNIEFVILENQPETASGNFTGSDIDIPLGDDDDDELVFDDDDDDDDLLEDDDDDDDDLAIERNQEEVQEVAATPEPQDEDLNLSDDLDLDDEDSSTAEEANSSPTEDDLDLSIDDDDEEDSSSDDDAGADLDLSIDDDDDNKDKEETNEDALNLDDNDEQEDSSEDDLTVEASEETPEEEIGEVSEVIMDLPSRTKEEPAEEEPENEVGEVSEVIMDLPARTKEEKEEPEEEVNLNDDIDLDEETAIKPVVEVEKSVPLDEGDASIHLAADDDTEINEADETPKKPSLLGRLFGKKKVEGPEALDLDDEIPTEINEVEIEDEGEELEEAQEDNLEAGLGLDQETDTNLGVNDALARKREKREEEAQSPEKKKGFSFFSKKKKISKPKVSSSKKGGILHKLNPFKATKIFQVSFKIRLYIFVATMCLLYVLGYQLLPNSAFNSDFDSKVNYIATYVKKDYLTKTLIPMMEREIPGLKRKAHGMEKELLQKASELSGKTVKIIKEKTGELVEDDNNVETPKPAKKRRRRRGGFNQKFSKTPKSAANKFLTSNTSASKAVLKQLQIYLPKLRKVINKLGPTHDKVAVQVIRFLLLYLLYELIFNLFLGVSLLHFIYGIRVNGNFLFVRLKAILRTVFFFTFIPICLLTELPVLFQKRSVKEALSFTSYELNQFKLRQLVSFLLLPLIILLPLITPFFKGMDVANSIYTSTYKDHPSFLEKNNNKTNLLTMDKVLTPEHIENKYIGFNKRTIGLPKYVFIFPFIKKKGKNDPELGLFFYDHASGGEMIIKRGKIIDLTSFLDSASSNNPLFPHFFPSIHNYLKKDKKDKWDDSHNSEFAKLIDASVKLNFNVLNIDKVLDDPAGAATSFFDYLVSYGILTTGYINGRDILYKAFNIQALNLQLRKNQNPNYLYFRDNSNENAFCFAPIASTKLQSLCVSSKGNTKDLLSLVDGKILTNIKLEHKPNQNFTPEYNGDLAINYLNEISTTPTINSKNEKLLKYYKHFAMSAYTNGHRKYITFAKKALKNNLTYLNSLPEHKKASLGGIIQYLEKAIKKLKPKESCKDDMLCFTQAITKCGRASAKLKHLARYNNIKAVYEKEVYLFGENENKCHFLVKFSSIKTEYDDETKLKLSKTKSSDADILLAAQADSAEYLNQREKIYSCLFDVSDLSNLVNKWRNNESKLDDVKDCVEVDNIDESL